MDILRKVSHQNIRHAYSMIATGWPGKGVWVDAAPPNPQVRSVGGASLNA